MTDGNASNWSLILEDMTWSYSRITSFEKCPYQFFLKYLYPSRKKRLFYSDYGSFTHELLASYYRGEKEKNDLIIDYLVGFDQHVRGKAPSRKIYDAFMSQGLDCLSNLTPFPYEILQVEEETRFHVGKYEFVGIIDLLMRDPKDGKLIICDHKSHVFRPRTKKKTKGNEELDQYLRQLYLYAIAVEKKYGELPKELVFHSYRAQTLIREPFSIEKYEETKRWAESLVDRIINNTDWLPKGDWYTCKNICDVCHECEYEEP